MADATEYVCSLSDELQKKAEAELGETPERRKKAITNLRKSVKDFPGLKCPTDDRFLLKFLRARKFDEDRALDLIVKYFRARKQNPDVFTNFRPSAVKKVLEAGITSVLPGRDNFGRKIVYYRPGLFNPDDVTIHDLLRTNIMSLELLTEDEETQVNGVQLLLDANGFGMRQASYFSPSFAKQVIGILQEAFPGRLKGINYINEPGIISYLFAMVRPFMKEKLASRLHFHGSSYDSLHAQVPSRILPTVLGGAVENYTSEEWKETLLASENRFVEFEQYELIEDTPGMKGDDVKGDALGGMAGTFRKLNVD